MFFELTDLLTCPRCGPRHGLVLLVREVEERRVLSGWLGCPECRIDYPVTDGVADLRIAGQSPPDRADPLNDDELALKIVALTGMAHERGYLLLGDRLAHAASGVTELARELEVIAVCSAPAPGGVVERVSRIVSDVRYPLVEYRLRAVAIAPAGDRQLVAAAARRVAAGGRLVLFDAGDADLEEAELAGLVVVAAKERTAVAERSRL